ncbi:MAG: ParB N-terminal domain-containing protein [Patescibacteria group bacterium]
MAQPALRVVNNDEPTGAGTPLLVPLSKIRPYKGQPRKYFNKKEIAELADDIQLNKQETPSKVFAIADEPGYFEQIGGGRRYQAFQLIAERTGLDPVVECVLGTVKNAKDHFRQAVRDNVKRKGYIPRELADAYQQMYNDSELTTHEEKIYELMREMGEPEKHVVEHLLVASLPEEAKDLMNPDLLDKHLVFKVALQIARSTIDPALRVRLAKEASEQCMPLDRARIYIREQTGHTAYGQSGRPRVAADEYAAFRRALGGVKDRLGKVQETWDVVGLYQARSKPEADRQEDAAIIREMIAELEDLLKKVSEPSKPQASKPAAAANPKPAAPPAQPTTKVLTVEPPPRPTKQPKPAPVMAIPSTPLKATQKQKTITYYDDDLGRKVTDKVTRDKYIILWGKGQLGFQWDDKERPEWMPTLEAAQQDWDKFCE